MPRRALVVAYIFLVGIPLLALTGVIAVGRHLSAPPFIGGTWRIASDFGPLASACAGLPAAGREPALTITQSGRYLAVAFGAAPSDTVDGRLDGSDLRIGSPRLSGGPCGSVVITARLERSAGQDTLTGRIEAGGCAACAPVPFRAVRKRTTSLGKTGR